MSLTEKLTPYIQTVDGALDSALRFEPETRLVKAMRHMPMAGGKRLRPVMAMLVADAVSGSKEKALPYGVALEIIHNFTLLHDDIMDHDEKRRGIPTVHVAFDQSTAINAGDALFALAFEIMTTVEADPGELRFLIRDVANTVRRIGEGQQLDKEFEQRTDVSEQDYMKMIEYKTAVLFSVSAKGGAVVAGGSGEQVKAMTEYGRLIGLGFQIWDDYLGIKADEALLGKPVGSDVKNGKRTLIAVHGLERMDGLQKERFLKAYGNLRATQREVEDAIAVLDEVGAVEHARMQALDYCDKAKKLLESLPGSPSREILAEIADYMVKREK